MRLGSLKGVYHGATSVLPLKEMARDYSILVENASREIQCTKALFRAKAAIPTRGTGVYGTRQRASWMAKLQGIGLRLRAKERRRSG